MTARLRSWILAYKEPRDVLAFLESEILAHEWISQRLDCLATRKSWSPQESADTVVSSRSRGAHWVKWLWIQGVYAVFGIRGLLLLFSPILFPGNRLLPLFLGDSMAALGLPVRQMWYSLSVNYSLAFAVVKGFVKRAELMSGARRSNDARRLQFMTDFSANTLTPEELDSIRIPLALFYFGYRYFNGVIYATVCGNVALALAAATIDQPTDYPALLSNSLWAIVNWYWVFFAPAPLLQIFAYMCLATWRANRLLNDVKTAAQELLQLASARTDARGSRALLHHQMRRSQSTVTSATGDEDLWTDSRSSSVDMGAGERERLMKQSLNRLETRISRAGDTLAAYNQTMKQIFAVFRTLFLPIAATDVYVWFTGLAGVNFLSQAFVFALSINQLIVIYMFMSLGAAPRKRAAAIPRLLFALSARTAAPVATSIGTKAPTATGVRLPRRQRLILLRSIKQVTSHSRPLGFTCGDTFPFEAGSLLAFVAEISSTVLLFLEMIAQIPA